MKIRGNTVGTTLKPEKAVVKCQNLTEEEKAQARENIGAISADECANIVEGKLASITNAEEVAY